MGWQHWPGPRTCIVCGKPVKADEPAQMHTEIGPLGETTAQWCRHLRCAVPEWESTKKVTGLSVTAGTLRGN